MNARERMLLIVLVSILGVFGVGFGVNQYFIKPLRALNVKIADFNNENDEIEAKLDEYQRDKAAFTQVRRKNLPANATDASSEYMHYLQPLLDKSGLTEVEVTPSQAAEFKATVTVPNVKKTGHRIISYTVRAKGEMAQLVSAMAAMQKTPLEHRIKTLNIVRENISTAKNSNTKLVINMTVETLLPVRAENRPVPGSGEADARYIAGRRYQDLGEKNIFVDTSPRVITKSSEEDAPRRVPDDLVLKYVRLVMINPNQHEFFLRNRFVQAREMRHATKPGYDKFQIRDDDTGHVFVSAKVLRVDQRDVYFQLEHTKDVFCLHVGQSLADALYYVDEDGDKKVNALRIEKLDDLDLEYDAKWAEPKAGEKKKTPAKKGKN